MLENQISPLTEPLCHRIKKYAELEGNHQDHGVQLLAPCRTPQESHCVPNSVVQTLELCQALSCDPFPEEPAPVPRHTLGEEPFSDILISNLNLPWCDRRRLWQISGIDTLCFLFSEWILGVWLAENWALAPLLTRLWTYMKGCVLSVVKMSFHEFPTKCPN